MIYDINMWLLIIIDLTKKKQPQNPADSICYKNKCLESDWNNFVTYSQQEIMQYAHSTFPSVESIVHHLYTIRPPISGHSKMLLG